MVIEVSGLAVYPVKSLRGRWCDTLRVDQLGPAWDRRWLLVDADDGFITQRQVPQLCLADAQFDGEELWLGAEGFENLLVRLSDVFERAESREVRVWSDIVPALDAGDAAAQWCSRLAGRVVRLCFLAEETARAVDPEYGRTGDVVSFADGFPFLLINEDSIADISVELGRMMDPARFRPNILIRGAGALAEENWRRLRIGELEFDVVKPCSRCVMPSINPVTAERETDVLQVLRNYRRADGKVYFGQNLIHRGRGRIGLGDRVTVLD